MSSEMRKALAPYEGQRVHVVGYFSASNVAYPAHIKVACVQDCEVTTPDKKIHYIGHTWVQHANAIVNCRPLKGAKVTFTATVAPYSRRLPVPNSLGVMKEEAWGLTRPDGVEVASTAELDFPEAVHANALRLPPVSSAIAPSQATAPAPAGAQRSTVQIVRAVKELMKEVDADTLRKAVPHLAKITAAVEQSGGERDFLSLLDAFGG